MQAKPDGTAIQTNSRPPGQGLVEADVAPSTPLRVAIVGGGIGGLALATLLATSAIKSGSDLKISIYEAASSLTELGAGIGVWLRTWRILSSAGFAEDLRGIAPSGRDLTDGLRKAFEYRRGDRSPEGRSFHSMNIPFGVLTLHRADFQRVLARHAIPPAQPYFGKRLIGYEYADENDLSSEIILKFVDGSTARADLLVGADGIRSPVRRAVIHRLVQRGILTITKDSLVSISNDAVPATTTDDTEAIGTSEVQTLISAKRLDTDGYEHGVMDAISDLVEPVWSGTLVYRSLIPLEALDVRFPGHRAGRGPVVYFGKNQHVIAFPISAGGSSVSNIGAESPTMTLTQMVNLVAFVSDPSREGTRLPYGEAWVRPASREEVISKFGGWEDEVIALLELAEKPLAWAIHTVNPLPCYSDADGRVVLLGDAVSPDQFFAPAHAMTPHQGAGGGQAIEDAHVLAELLTHPCLTHATLPGALRAYDAVRVPASQRVVRNSRLTGMMYELNHGWDDDPEPSLTDEQRKCGDERKGIEDGQHVDQIALGGEGDADAEELELKRLRALADVIMEIHKWEWEDDGGPSESGSGDWDQAKQAVRLFEDSMMRQVSEELEHR